MSEMQLRLREECDVENTFVGLSLDGQMISYGTYEDLCCMENEIWG